MSRTSDALELLTAQHDQLDVMLSSLDTIPSEHRALALGRFADRLTAHLAVEHELFLPRIGDALASKHVSDQEVLVEAVAQSLSVELSTAPTRELDETLAELRALLDRHARVQEDALFVAVAEQMSESSLAGLGDELRAKFERSLCIAG